jgi:hypothetical protein
MVMVTLHTADNSFILRLTPGPPIKVLMLQVFEHEGPHSPGDFSPTPFHFSHKHTPSPQLGGLVFWSRYFFLG